jgi:hypothetical protein
MTVDEIWAKYETAYAVLKQAEDEQDPAIKRYAKVVDYWEQEFNKATCQDEQPEPYTNQGKGLVFGATSAQIEHLMVCFGQRARWYNYELNEKLGWQFSQVIYAARQLGHNIVTLRMKAADIGGRTGVFAYELREGAQAVAKWDVCPHCKHRKRGTGAADAT